MDLKEEEIQVYHQKQNLTPQEHNIIRVASGYSLVNIDGRGQQSKGRNYHLTLSGVVALNGMNHNSH